MYGRRCIAVGSPVSGIHRSLLLSIMYFNINFLTPCSVPFEAPALPSGEGNRAPGLVPGEETYEMCGSSAQSQRCFLCFLRSCGPKTTCPPPSLCPPLDPQSGIPLSGQR